MVIKTQARPNEQITKLHSSEKELNETQPLLSIYSSSSSSTSISPLIYVTDEKNDQNNPENPFITKDEEVFDGVDLDEIHDTFPLFFRDVDVIYIPKGVKRALVRNIPKSYLSAINKNQNIAVEKSLEIVSNLSSTIYSDDRWKGLSSKFMDQQTKNGNDNTIIYSKIIKALKYCRDTTDPIVIVKKNKYGQETYQEGVSCKQYSLSDTYYNSGLIEYKIQDKQILENRKKLLYGQLKKAFNNVIGSNLLGIYSQISLPNHHDIKIQARKLIKERYKNKKGLKLTFLNKHPKSYYKDARSRSFVEQNIKHFEYLTTKGYMIPTVGDEKSGGRVVDSFNLMPNWIRKLIKIEGESIVEIDLRAFHPNIAMSLYGGSKKHLTHEIVAEESNLDKSTVKREHLSYFNKRVTGMKNSSLYNYYNEHEPTMNEAIIAEKTNSHKGHYITSMRMFAKEVEIMTECIKQLNSIGIYVIYVYDALYCKRSVSKIVKDTMDKVVLEFGVYTTAKISE